MNERVEEIRRQAVDLVDDFVIFHAPEGVVTGRMMADLTDRVSNLLTAALAQAERERDEARAERNARARDVMHLEAEVERLRLENQSLREGWKVSNEAVTVLTTDLARVRALEAALHEIKSLSKTVHASLWSVLERSIIEIALTALREHAALTEPMPPQKEPRT